MDEMSHNAVVSISVACAIVGQLVALGVWFLAPLPVIYAIYKLEMRRRAYLRWRYGNG